MARRLSRKKVKPKRSKYVLCPYVLQRIHAEICRLQQVLPGCKSRKKRKPNETNHPRCHVCVVWRRSLPPERRFPLKKARRVVHLTPMPEKLERIRFCRKTVIEVFDLPKYKRVPIKRTRDRMRGGDENENR